MSTTLTSREKDHLLEGYLEKQGAGLSTRFKKRYFKLEPNTPYLYYYKTSRDATSPRRSCGFIDLSKVITVERKPENPQQPRASFRRATVGSFYFHVITHDRTYVLAASSNDDVKRWMENLTYHIRTMNIRSSLLLENPNPLNSIDDVQEAITRFEEEERQRNIRKDQHKQQELEKSAALNNNNNEPERDIIIEDISDVIVSNTTDLQDQTVESLFEQIENLIEERKIDKRVNFFVSQFPTVKKIDREVLTDFQLQTQLSRQIGSNTQLEQDQIVRIQEIITKIEEKLNGFQQLSEQDKKLFESVQDAHEKLQELILVNQQSEIAHQSLQQCTNTIHALSEALETAKTKLIEYENDLERLKQEQEEKTKRISTLQEASRKVRAREVIIQERLATISTLLEEATSEMVSVELRDERSLLADENDSVRREILDFQTQIEQDTKDIEEIEKKLVEITVSMEDIRVQSHTNEEQKSKLESEQSLYENQVSSSDTQDDASIPFSELRRSCSDTIRAYLSFRQPFVLQLAELKSLFELNDKFQVYRRTFIEKRLDDTDKLFHSQLAYRLVLDQGYRDIIPHYTPSSAIALDDLTSVGYLEHILDSKNDPTQSEAFISMEEECKQLRERVTALEQREQHLQQRINEQADELAQRPTQLDVETLQHQLLELQSQFDIISNEYTTYKQEQEDKQEQERNQPTTPIATIEKALCDREWEVSSLSEQLRTLQAENEVLVHDYQQESTRAQELQAEIRGKDQMLVTLRTELDQVRTRVSPSELERALGRLKAANYAHQSQNSELEREILRLKQHNKVKVEQKDLLIERMKTYQDTLRNELQLLRRQVLDLDNLDEIAKKELEELEWLKKEFFYSLALGVKLEMATRSISCNFNAFDLYQEACYSAPIEKWSTWLSDRVEEEYYQDKLRNGNPANALAGNPRVERLAKRSASII